MNELIEFEYTTTTEGILDEGNFGDKIIIRVWDEDIGIKVNWALIFEIKCIISEFKALVLNLTNIYSVFLHSVSEPDDTEWFRL